VRLPRPAATLARLAARAALALTGAALGLLLAEAVARVRTPAAGANLLYGAPQAVPASFFDWDPTLGPVPAPGQRTRVQTIDYDITLRTNALGLRGPPTTGHPALLVLGDSVVLALQVDEADTLSSRLGAATGLQPLNAGADGTGTWAQAHRLRRLRPSLPPLAHIVLVFFTGNDFSDNARWLADGGPQGRLRPPPPNPGALGPLRAGGPRGWLARHSALYALFTVAARRAALQQRPPNPQDPHARELLPFAAGGPDEATPAAEAARAPLRLLAAEAAAARAPLTVAIAPPLFAIDPAEAQGLFALYGLAGRPLALDAPAAALRRVLAAEGIAACDLGPALRARHAAGERPYFRYDGHWNAVGHAVAAEALVGCGVGRPGG